MFGISDKMSTHYDFEKTDGQTERWALYTRVYVHLRPIAMGGFYMTGVCADAEETAFGAFGNSLRQVQPRGTTRLPLNIFP
jgi:hypothetical protein